MMNVKESKHRTFIAIDFPVEIVKEVSRVQDVLRKWKFVGKLTELENLHLTLKFLGEIDFEKLERVKERLREIKMEEFEARLDSVGVFSFKGKPRIVWIKVGGKGVIDLQAKVDEVLKEEGFEKETRFMSHMTIARIKYVKDKSGFLDFVKGLNVKSIGFKVKGFKLKKSELRETGAVYEDIEVF